MLLLKKKKGKWKGLNTLSSSIKVVSDGLGIPKAVSFSRAMHFHLSSVGKLS